MYKEQIKDIFMNIIEILFPSNIWNWNYIGSLWHKYANFYGFFIGILLLVIVYFASDSLDEISYKVTDKKRDSIRVLALVALINAVDSVYYIFQLFINKYILHIEKSIIEDNIHGAFNPLSIMILCLVISECYEDDKRKAFFFGVSTFGVSILMFGSNSLEQNNMLFLLIRVVLAGILCSICIKLKYIYSSYILMNVYFIITETILSYLIFMNSGDGFKVLKSKELWIKTIPEILTNYKAEYIIILLITVMWIIFEKFVLKKSFKSKKY